MPVWATEPPGAALGDQSSPQPTEKPASDSGKKADAPVWSAVAGSVWLEETFDFRRTAYATAEQFEEKDKAEQNALRTCRAASGQDCEVIASTSKDCVYYSVGFVGDDATHKWLTADTAAAIAGRCKAENLDCIGDPIKLCPATGSLDLAGQRKFNSTVIGEALLDDDEFDDVKAPLSWVAAAAAGWHDKGGRPHALATYAEHYADKQAAEKAALDQCRSIGGGPDCKVTGSSSDVCLYITTDQVGTKVGWLQRTTLSDLAQRCAENGYVCAVPVGGCPDATTAAGATVFVKN